MERKPRKIIGLRANHERYQMATGSVTPNAR